MQSRLVAADASDAAVALVQIAVPSRTRVPEYRTLARQVEDLVAHIVARFSIDGWLPIRYLYKQYNPGVLVAYYLAADVALVTPLTDGMNLVAKEYVATRSDESGVLIFSTLAGAMSVGLRIGEGQGADLAAIAVGLEYGCGASGG